MLVTGLPYRFRRVDILLVESYLLRPFRLGQLQPIAAWTC